MVIGDVARITGVSAKRIRYYESINLIKQSQRTDSGYRIYNQNDLRTLRFINNARKLGFSIDQIRELIDLWQDSGRSNADVRKLTAAHVADLESRIREMVEMRDTLSQLLARCTEGHGSECPILHGVVA
jgi:MerR family copper efflux transcriptional regulator